MHRQIINVVVCLAKHRFFPFAKGRHVLMRTSAGNQLNGVIDPFHDFCCFTCSTCVFSRCFMSNLPRTIHLIAKTPGMNAKRLFKAIRAAHISIISIGYGIAVFDNITGFFRPTCPKIYCHHNVRSHTFCPFLKFIDSDFICLHRTPCKLHFLRTLFFWPGSIFPMVTRYKVTTRITNHRNVHLTDNLKNILAKSHIIGSLMSRLIDTMINGSSQMLNK